MKGGEKLQQAIEIGSTPISPQKSSHLACAKGRAAAAAPTGDGFASFLRSLLVTDKQSKSSKAETPSKEGLWELAGAGIIFPLSTPDPLLMVEEQAETDMVEQAETGMVEQAKTSMVEQAETDAPAQAGTDVKNEAVEASFREGAVDSVWGKLMDVAEEESGIDRDQDNIVGERIAQAAEVRIDLQTETSEGASRAHENPKLMESPKRTIEEDLREIPETEELGELDPIRVEEELGRIRGDKGEFMVEGRTKDGRDFQHKGDSVRAEARSIWKDIFAEEQTARKNQNYGGLYRVGSDVSGQEESLLETGEGATRPFKETIEEKVIVDTTTHLNTSFNSTITRLTGETTEASLSGKAGETFELKHPIRQDEVLRQIVTGARLMVKDGTARVHMQLEPKELGKVQLALVIERDLVTARFVTESKAVQSLIEANLSDLRSSLQEAGLQADLLQVSVQTGGFNHRDQAFYAFKEIPAKGPYQGEEELPPEEVSLAERRGRQRPGGVDIRV